MDKVYNKPTDAALVEAIQAAPLATRIELAIKLQANLRNTLLPTECESRLVEVMNGMVGFDIRIRSKEEPFVRARCVVCYVARSVVGLKQVAVARLLKISGTDVCYLTEKMRGVVTSPFFPDYIRLFEEYVTRLENYGKS